MKALFEAPTKYSGTGLFAAAVIKMTCCGYCLWFAKQ